MHDEHFAPPSPYETSPRGRRPRCGQGRLFDGVLATAPRCGVCGLDCGFIDAGDGPAVFVVLIAGFVVVGAALVTEVAYRLHALLWLPPTLLMTLGMVRPLKGLMISLQYHHKAAEGRSADR